MNTRTELENKMVQELQRAIDALHEAKQEDDYITQQYWSEYYRTCKEFVETVTDGWVELCHWKVTLHDCEP